MKHGLRYRPSTGPSKYQHRADPLKRMAEHGRPEIEAAAKKALRQFRESLPVKAMAAAIGRHDYTAAADAVHMGGFEQGLRELFKPIAALHAKGAELGAQQITGALKQARRVTKDSRTYSGEPEAPLDQFAFDLFTDEVLAELKKYQDDLITSMTDYGRQAVYRAILAGAKAGDDPADIAKQIRDVIGLNDRQAAAVQNYRSALQQTRAAALNRAFRDTSADGEVQAAIDAGEAMSEDRIDELVDAYAERTLDYRAKMIADTESNRAVNMGLQQSYRQAIDKNVFPEEAVRQFWMVSLDERTCEVCIGIADDTPDGIAIGDSFDSEDGPVDYPPAHPNCRCSLEMRTNLDMVSASGNEVARATA